MVLSRRLGIGLYGVWGVAAYSMNVTNCPGYTLDSMTESGNGLAAQLTLAGPSCNAFGHDIPDLTIQVVYQSSTTLHVKIFDTAEQQFTIPKSIIARPSAPVESYTSTSDLLFNYESSPFAFWITRRSEPDAMPLFDTRISSLPPTPIAPLNVSDPSTAFDAFPLVLEDQYLQVASALPYGTNIYGLGEVIASSGFRRDIGVNGGTGTIQTNWNRDIQDPINQNMYGTHPIYIEHRFDEITNKSSSSGVLLLSASGADIFLQTPPNSNISFIEYRMIGGILDFYFFSGLTPSGVVAQYGAIVGYPMWQPAWGFGFYLCRWGYSSIWEVKDVVAQMRAASIPQEVQWTDIDLYHAYRDFTTDPVSFPPEEVAKFVSDLAANNQYYIPIVDAAISVTDNSTDVYDPFTRGVEQDVWVKNPDSSLYIGEVWPGYTVHLIRLYLMVSGLPIWQVFPDWFSANVQSFWTEALTNWSEPGVGFSGIWLDMNEASSFCSYSCGTGANFSALTPMSMAGRVITDWPECYNATIWGSSGNMTINGVSTNSCPTNSTMTTVVKRGIGAGQEAGVNITNPPYAIHNAIGALSTNTIATNATHQGGYVELDVHNMFGLMEEKTTHLALRNTFPERRPFLISRSTFPSAGRWTGHWLGDNYSKWQYMYLSIQGILQFQIYQTPMESQHLRCDPTGTLPLAQRRRSIAHSYRSSLHSPSLLGGRDILVTPVLTPGAATVDGVFPGRENVIWRDWYIHAVVNATPGGDTTLDAPIGHINVHVRDNSALLLHQRPAYTIAETRAGPYSLLVSLSGTGTAFGTAYLDDGISPPPTPNRTVTFHVADGELAIKTDGTYVVQPKLSTITILGAAKPSAVTVKGQQVPEWNYTAPTEELILYHLAIDLGKDVNVSWQ
ncbi:glycosyl hydrolases family 31-domain-containing protein [Boletus coccyginus]|nr:glycosyl hydrolases family 31-domain-containing protein [Boletus coccyginus]